MLGLTQKSWHLSQQKAEKTQAWGFAAVSLDQICVGLPFPSGSGPGNRAAKVAEESHVVHAVHRISSRQLGGDTHQHAYQVAATEEEPKGGRGCGPRANASLSSVIITPGRTLGRKFFLAICPTRFKSCRCTISSSTLGTEHVL